MDVNGACHCGAITYSAVVDPMRVTICHCADCQALTGTAYRVSVRVARDDFRLLSGTPAVYVKTAESGAKRVQAFCATCGSPIFAHGLGDSTTLGLRVGCIEQRRELRPQLQIWCRSALDWTTDLDGIARRERE